MSKPTQQGAGESLGADQVSSVSGGESWVCNPDDIQNLIDGLKQNYESLIELTSYVMDRVSGK